MKNTSCQAVGPAIADGHGASFRANLVRETAPIAWLQGPRPPAGELSRTRTERHGTSADLHPPTRSHSVQNIVLGSIKNPPKFP